MLCSTLLPYQNALTDPLLRCPIALYPSAFDHPSPPSPATQQASRAHDKRDLYNTCIVSQLSRNKYCLNQGNALIYNHLSTSIWYSRYIQDCSIPFRLTGNKTYSEGYRPIFNIIIK